MVIVALNVLDWSVCIGGKHLTGEVVISDPYQSIELTRKLDRREKKERQEREGRMFNFPEETETNKFDNYEQLERAALKWCEGNLGDEWLLQYHNNYGPNRPVGGKGFIESRIPYLKELAELWDKVPNSARTNSLMNEVYRAWEILVKR